MVLELYRYRYICRLRDYPGQDPSLFLMAARVGFSCIYLGDHYPGDVLSGVFSGMALAEIVQQEQRALVRVAGSEIG